MKVSGYIDNDMVDILTIDTDGKYVSFNGSTMLLDDFLTWYPLRSKLIDRESIPYQLWTYNIDRILDDEISAGLYVYDVYANSAYDGLEPLELSSYTGPALLHTVNVVTVERHAVWRPDAGMIVTQ